MVTDRKRLRLTLPFVLIAALPPSESRAEDPSYSLEYGGLTRTYLVHPRLECAQPLHLAEADPRTAASPAR